MYFARMPRCLRSSSAAASASTRIPSLSSGMPHRVHPQSVEARQRALITFLLNENRISRREQQTVDQIEPLQRSRGDQDFIGSAGDAGGTLELVGQEFPQRTLAERPAVEAVGRKRRAFALERGRRVRNETL